MADKDKEHKETKQGASEKSAEAKTGVLTWAVMGVVIVVLSGSGFFLGRLLAGSPQTSEVATVSKEEPNPAKPSPAATGKQVSAETWYYKDMESVVVNPDEPGATRFVRVGLILEVSNELGETEAKEMFLAKNPLLINWLNLYFKSLSLSQMENEKDMKRILSQICDGFNEILFPEAKPQIKHVLIREFNIQ